MLGDNILNQHVAADGSCGSHVGAGLDLVGDDGISTAVELFDTADLDGIGTCAGDGCAHGVQEVGHINDMGLLCGVADDGLAGQQAGSQHQVDGGADGSHIQVDTGAVETVGAGVQADVCRGVLHISAQQAEALQVLVDGTLGKLTAAGQSNVGRAETAQQNTHQVVAGTHLLDQCVLRTGGRDMGGVDLQDVQLRLLNSGAHAAQDVDEDANVGNIGDILNADLASDEQGAGENCNCGILCAADGNGTVQSVAAVNFISSQG